MSTAALLTIAAAGILILLLLPRADGSAADRGGVHHRGGRAGLAGFGYGRSGWHRRPHRPGPPAVAAVLFVVFA
jgi:hypothetical protein